LTIDWNRIAQLQTEYSQLDTLDAYYRRRSIRYRTSNVLRLSNLDIITATAGRGDSVLDIGCGDGQTLASLSPRIANGTGYDQSEFAIACAKRNAAERGITNLEFIIGKAVDLPFEDGRFDFVFSERGPIGHSDLTMEPALRVLRPGGYIFYETLPVMGPGSTLLTSLENERNRLERFGIEIKVLAVNVRTEIYGDFYQWAEMQCAIGRYLGEQAPFDSLLPERAEAVAARSDRSDGSLPMPYHSIWAGGMKPR
jgi:SAM-dependent methyltransferase